MKFKISKYSGRQLLIGEKGLCVVLCTLCWPPVMPVCQDRGFASAQLQVTNLLPCCQFSFQLTIRQPTFLLATWTRGKTFVWYHSFKDAIPLDSCDRSRMQIDNLSEKRWRRVVYRPLLSFPFSFLEGAQTGKWEYEGVGAELIILGFCYFQPTALTDGL